VGLFGKKKEEYACCRGDIEDLIVKEGKKEN